MNLLISIIRLWQKTRLVRSALSFSECRFYPSCSDYAVESIKSYGVFKGLFLSLKRLCKCHPFCEGGIDKVRSN